MVGRFGSHRLHSLRIPANTPLTHAHTLLNAVSRPLPFNTDLWNEGGHDDRERVDWSECVWKENNFV